MPAKLTDAEIEAALSGLPGWAHRDGFLVKRFPVPAYMEGVAFAERIAVDAEARDHHPDLLIRYADVTVSLRTHSADGITTRDVESAKTIDGIAGTLFGK